LMAPEPTKSPQTLANTTHHRLPKNFPMRFPRRYR
jgi:hypothetical protein